MVTRQKERSTFAISDVEVTNKDYSGLVADNFSVSNSSFRQCKFERMEVREASFGLRRGTQFIECSFARSDLTSHALGLSRFVRCSFEDVASINGSLRNRTLSNVLSAELHLAPFSQLSGSKSEEI